LEFLSKRLDVWYTRICACVREIEDMEEIERKKTRHRGHYRSAFQRISLAYSSVQSVVHTRSIVVAVDILYVCIDVRGATRVHWT
jgi:hypothetical protein